MTPNYFENLGTRGSSGRTSLILTPAQYRTDAATRSDRGAHQHPSGVLAPRRPAVLQLRHPGTSTATGPTPPPRPRSAPSRAPRPAAPSPSPRPSPATRAPGVQEVWATWSAGPDASGNGAWQSVDLTQSATDSTRWSGTLDVAELPAGADASDLRFLVQAVNGAGAVALDTAEGDGHPVVPATADTAEISLGLSGPITQQAPGIVATVTGSGGAAVPDRTVRFTVAQGTRQVVSLAPTERDGSGASSRCRCRTTARRSGCRRGRSRSPRSLLPALGSGTDEVTDSDSRAGVVQAAYTLTVTPPFSFTRAGTTYPWLLRPIATVREGDARAAGVPVTFTLPTSGPRASFAGGAARWVGTTDAQGRVQVPAVTAAAPVGVFAMTVEVDGAEPRTVPMAAQYALTPFKSPVSNSGVTRTTPTATVPLRTTALLANGAKLSDADAAALVRAGRVQVAWHSTSSSASGARTDLATLRRSRGHLRGEPQGVVAGLAPGPDVRRGAADPARPPVLRRCSTWGRGSRRSR